MVSLSNYVLWQIDDSVFSIVKYADVCNCGLWHIEHNACKVRYSGNSTEQTTASFRGWLSRVEPVSLAQMAGVKGKKMLAHQHKKSNETPRLTQKAFGTGVERRIPSVPPSKKTVISPNTTFLRVERTERDGQEL